jgi:hypothetical protein
LLLQPLADTSGYLGERTGHCEGGRFGHRRATTEVKPERPGQQRRQDE